MDSQFYSVDPLASLMPVPDCFDYCTFVISFEVRVCEFPNFVSHFQNYYHFQDYFHIQGFWGLLNFCMHFRIILPSFSKVALKILIMITLQITLESNAMLVICDFLICECGMSFNLFVFFNLFLLYVL